MSFPVRFLGEVSAFQNYRMPMDFLPAALAVRLESYRADLSPGEGAPHLAALSGLGDGVGICDFFVPLEAKMLMIDDTELVWWMRDRISAKSIRAMAEEFADKCRRKMSGSAEVLCALYAKFVTAKEGENPPQADCEFWVVVTDIDSHKGDTLAYDALVDRARKILRDKLPHPYVLVEITGQDGFARELENRIPCN